MFLGFCNDYRCRWHWCRYRCCDSSLWGRPFLNLILLSFLFLSPLRFLGILLFSFGICLRLGKPCLRIICIRGYIPSTPEISRSGIQYGINGINIIQNAFTGTAYLKHFADDLTFVWFIALRYSAVLIYPA